MCVCVHMHTHTHALAVKHTHQNIVSTISLMTFDIQHFVFPCSQNIHQCLQICIGADSVFLKVCSAASVSFGPQPLYNGVVSAHTEFWGELIMGNEKKSEHLQGNHGKCTHTQKQKQKK